MCKSSTFCPQAYNIILEHVRSDSPAWAVLGEKVCLQAWKVLRGLGDWGWSEQFF